MNFSSILFIVVMALVSEPGICEPNALVRSLLARKSFELTGGIKNGTERTLSTRTAPDLNTFIVESIQTSATLSQADKQSLLSDYFNFIYRNGAMGGLLKDLFGIISPAPAPVPKCLTELTIGFMGIEYISSDGYPQNYLSDKRIDCTYFVKGRSEVSNFEIAFVDEIAIDSTKASVKVYDGPTFDSVLLLDVKTGQSNELRSTADVFTVRFQSEIGAVGRWKIRITAN